MVYCPGSDPGVPGLPEQKHPAVQADDHSDHDMPSQYHVHVPQVPGAGVVVLLVVELLEVELVVLLDGALVDVLDVELVGAAVVVVVVQM